MTPKRRRLADVVGHTFNAPLVRALVRIGFRLLSLASGVRGVDYFYDRRERVWVARSGDVYLATGLHVSRFWPKVVRQYVETKLRESQDYYLYRAPIRAGAVIIDVGAGNGVDTVLFSRLAGASGRVLAVEAHPKTIRLLRATCFHNKLSNVTIVHNAVMDSIRRVGISDLSNHLANHVQIENDMEGHQIVDTTTMDALCDKYDISTIDLMKMNIEGAETHAIKGMTTTIAKVHHACIACHDFIQPNPDGRITRAVTTFMTSNGFDVRDRKTDERPWVREHLYFERRPSHVKDADMSHVY